MPSEQAFPVVIEFQKVELTRLLKENGRLNRRFDRLMDELGHLREMQQREQVLRQQEQGLRQQLQITVDRLTERLVLPGPATAPTIAPGHTKPALDARAVPPARPGAGLAPAPPPPPGAIAPAPPIRRPAARNMPSASDPEAAELADILKEVGQSLRDFETSPPEPPPAPAGREALAEEPDPLDDMISQLDSSEEDRRNTARIMKRLFRNRNGSRRRDP